MIFSIDVCNYFSDIKNKIKYEQIIGYKIDLIVLWFQHVLINLFVLRSSIKKQY